MRTRRALLIGHGAVGATLSDDPRVRTTYRYATHADVLAHHAAIKWDGIVEPDPRARQDAADRHGVPVYARIQDVPDPDTYDLAVVATPPDYRPLLHEELPGLQAMVIEKPLGESLASAQAFVQAAERHGIAVQVNLWRRADAAMRDLQAGGLAQRIGSVQTAFATYGRGLRNNGTHLIDLTRMLLGEIDHVHPAAPPTASRDHTNDVAVDFHIDHEGGNRTHVAALDHCHYREVSLDVWGTDGRLFIGNEGLSILEHGIQPNRGLSDAREVDHERPQRLPPTAGEAFLHLYDNLLDHLEHGTALWSPASSALVTTRWIEQIAPKVVAPEPIQR